MKKYPYYIDTQLPWIQSIPGHWKLLRNKIFLLEREEKSTTGDEPLLSLSQYTGISIKGKNTEKTGMIKAESLIGYKAVFINDIVMNIMLAWNGSTARSKYEGIISPAYAIYKVINDTANPDYLHYIFKTPQYMKYFEAFSTGIIKSRLRLYPQSFLSLYTIIPPHDEQDQIVRFLDWKVSRINRVINNKKKQLLMLEERKMAIVNDVLTGGIAGVKYKPSGIEGLSVIPEVWYEKALKCYVTSNDESLSSKMPDEYEFNYIDISTTGFRRLKKAPVHLTFEEAPSRARRIVREGDTILSTVRTYLKAILYIDCKKDGYIVSTGFSVLRPKDGIYPPLLSYALSCDYFINSVIKNSVGVSYPAISDRKLLSLKLALPASYKEQVELYDYITKLTASTDSAINYINNMIKELQELKERIISDAVTGKIDVRDIEIPEYEFVEEDTRINDEEDNEKVEEEENEAWHSPTQKKTALKPLL